MNFELKLAFKYFRARRKSVARLTAIVAVAGIASGVASLIIAQALARGFAAEMQDKILGNTAHIAVFLPNGAQISDWRKIKNDLEKQENVRQVAPTTYESALVTGEKATSYAVLRLTENGKPDAENKTGAPQPEIEIAVGAELAEKAGLKIGEEAEIILPTDNNFLPKRSRVRVREIFRTGLYDYDSTWIRVSPEDLARLYGEEDFSPTVLNVSLKDIYAADKTAAELRAGLPPDFKVLDWQTANQPLFAALSLERKVALAIISLIIFIGALNITTTLALLVNERKLDIAVLRTCGARGRSLVFIFLLEGLFLGSTGIAGGVFFGWGACFIANYFRLVSLPADVYSLSFVPLDTNFNDILLIVGVAFLLISAATVYPARRASRIKPLENLRNA